MTIWNISGFSAIVLSLVLEAVALKDHYTDSHTSLHKIIRRTHSHLQDFEIAIPKIIDVDGNHVTHVLRHSRMRRSLTLSEPKLFMQVTSHGNKFHVELETNRDLLSPEFIVTNIRRNESTRERIKERNTNILDCHYTARMISHENRTTALSVCDGISGLLRTKNDDFIIEPVPSHIPQDFSQPQRPHIIYKRKHLHRKSERLHYCGKQKRHPLSTSLDGISGIKELSNGEMLIVRESEQKEKKAATAEEVERKRKRRNAKSENENKKIVETVVVADQRLIESHKNDSVDVTTYVLTVMNMMSSLFKDGTLDEPIIISLMEIVLLEDDTELSLDHKADKSLASFCKWQTKFNTSTGKKPDHSILLTGIDICVDRNVPCDTLGLAQIGGMCTPSDSCTINEDMGLGLAFTVAHETGHSFGMKHDGQGNQCGKRDGHIMSSTLSTVNGVFTWSSCSRNTMKRFFKTKRSHCLDNEPTSTYVRNVTENLPGYKFNATTQCQLQYGNTAKLCTQRYQYNNMHMICKTLWCKIENEECKSKYMPAAEGTLCGQQKWCRRGVCVAKDAPVPQPIDGGWSKYGPWSDCSRTCGGGVSFRQRFCDNPAAIYGGRYCEGDEKIYVLCNIQKCGVGSIDYRSKQCAEFNSQPYRHQYFSWIPFIKYWNYDFNKCALLCEADGFGFFDQLSPQVKDGTSCGDGSNDVCISGQCVHVGCDYVLNSNATVDACGVCNGDNSTCVFVSGSFEQQVPDSGYYHLVTIPKGARSIRIWEHECCTHTYISARSPTDLSMYYLNGNWRVDLYGTVKFAGANWKYERKNLKNETLSTEGPLTEDVTIEALIVQKNPGVSYSYARHEVKNTLAHDLTTEYRPRHSYSWNEEFTLCSKSCAGGERQNSLVCLEDEKHAVNDSYCDDVPKPKQRVEKCNTQLCPANWVAKDWGDCSRTCGGGIQTRRVTCQRSTETGLEDTSPKECDHSNKPSRNQICAKNDCPPEWKTSRWSQCSRSCGRGVRTRSIYCKSGMRKISQDLCDNDLKPIFRQTCTITYCRRRFQWLISTWTSCSVTCGEGRQTRNWKCTFSDGKSRRIKSVNHRRCKNIRKQNLSIHKTCLKPNCTLNLTNVSLENFTKPIGKSVSRHRTNIPHQIKESAKKWVSMQWQQCTATCGGGHQVRAVKCMKNGKPSVECLYDNKPANIRSCNSGDCSSIKETCKDSFTWCHLVPQHKTCSHKYFGKVCCKSCRGSSTRPK